jgi:hypothetical protein
MRVDEIGADRVFMDFNTTNGRRHCDRPQRLAGPIVASYIDNPINPDEADT